MHTTDWDQLISPATRKDLEKVIHAFITSRLDYYNAIYSSISKKNIWRSQAGKGNVSEIKTHCYRLVFINQWFYCNYAIFLSLYGIFFHACFIVLGILCLICFYWKELCHFGLEWCEINNVKMYSYYNNRDKNNKRNPYNKQHRQSITRHTMDHHIRPCNPPNTDI